MAGSDDIFDENGKVKKTVHDAHHVFIHQIKTEKERKAEEASKIKTAVIIMILGFIGSSFFGIIWYAFNTYVGAQNV
jgi:hypothetical protein